MKNHSQNVEQFLLVQEQYLF